MTLGFPTILTKILALIPIDRYRKIGIICVKDSCLQIPLTAAQDLQSRGLGNSLTTCSLHDDRQAENKQYTQNKSNRIANRTISI
jgi:hypothetical protein